MSNAIVPIPKADVNVRLATIDDLPFIDSLQKKFGKQLGFQATSWIESRIAKGEVLVADGAGYIIFQDKYLKREELGLVVQLCVDPTKQRGLVGAMLVKAAFERSAHGCRLFCLWCAQDLEANKFWESIGFVPLAYRAGSEKKRVRPGSPRGRVHIFWQKRIRDGDVSTPWWFPSQTTGGAMGAPRLVFPIPNDRHWSDEMPMILPNEPAKPQAAGAGSLAVSQTGARKRPVPTIAAPKRGGISRAHFLSFAPPKPVAPAKPEKKPREKKPKQKNDPKLVAAARELNGRWLDHVNSGQTLIESAGKCDVTRMLPVTPSPLHPITPSSSRVLHAA